MSLLAVWYSHSEDGRRFVEGRDLRMLLVVAGIAAAYALVRTRQRFSHVESWWPSAARALTGASLATALWFAVDWVRGEGWVPQVLGALLNGDEGAVAYAMVIVAGWLGWSITILEVLRRITIRRYARRAEPGTAANGERAAGSS
ncbi:MAG: hypothetical protein FJ304_06500 [Planctomycetes bacterium]|nr:hypothetical protein [Planctomycetota bacterium]